VFSDRSTIAFSRSLDGGRAFDPPRHLVEVQLNPDPSVVECDVPTGLGDRADPAVSLIDTFLIRSRDGGVTFGQPVRVSSATSNWCNIDFILASGLLSNLGDYFGIWAGADRTFIAWPDARNGFADVFFAEVGDAERPAP
jgi:hypothetical protein